MRKYVTDFQRISCELERIHLLRQNLGLEPSRVCQLRARARQRFARRAVILLTTIAWSTMQRRCRVFLPCDFARIAQRSGEQVARF
jgi:hypothetical protein